MHYSKYIFVIRMYFWILISFPKLIFQLNNIIYTPTYAYTYTHTCEYAYISTHTYTHTWTS